MLIDSLRRQHRNMETLLDVLEREQHVFDRGGRPDYEVIHAIISYFEVYPTACHHPQEDLILARLAVRDPVAAEAVGDLASEHRNGVVRLRRVARAVEDVLSGGAITRSGVNAILRHFINSERRHIAIEERVFFPAALKALRQEDWVQIACAISEGKDPLVSKAAEDGFNTVRRHILQLEAEAEAIRA
ncbi:Hemerythrin-like domain-containing protein [Methylocapsa palsarum]|uniref:Hemerythrin-like domain-containing protein n=2 Tax=Methylocapsa palsarum TaxID=1612308 RepID=A0A1I3XZ71_9HYPH|nr:Hemerythrin-like domain-containing protein [Methylocapsa palsarum]